VGFVGERIAPGLKDARATPDAPCVGYSDQATSGARRRRGEARAYDFRRPVRLAREHAHVLRVAMQTFARQTSTLLTTSLRVVCLFGGVQIEELSYDEYLSGLAENTMSAVVTLEPWQGKALLTFDSATLLTMLDYQLGGKGGQEQPDRPLTDIEQAIFRQLFARMLRELAYALEPIARLNPQLSALETNAQFVQAAAPTDPVVVARMELSVGERESSASVCLPYAMLHGPLAALTKAGDEGDKARVRLAAAGRTQRRLTDVEVDVAVRFEPLRLSSETIGRLEIGDVITLNHRTTAPLAVTSAATTFARAVPGSSGRQLAILIVP
jgi:flagellar motor switch protein FliM